MYMFRVYAILRQLLPRSSVGSYILKDLVARFGEVGEDMNQRNKDYQPMLLL